MVIMKEKQFKPGVRDRREQMPLPSFYNPPPFSKPRLSRVLQVVF
jgi:hypothetical protein